MSELSKRPTVGAGALVAASSAGAALLPTGAVLWAVARQAPPGGAPVGMGLALAAMGGLLAFALLYHQLVRPLRALEAALGSAPQEAGRVTAAGARELAGCGRRVARLAERAATLARALDEPARVLDASVEGLAASTQEQTQTITRQAAALQEAQVTVQEIRQTSSLAAQKAEAVLRVAERADELGRIGEAAVEETLASLRALRQEAETIAQKIGELAERARQIGGITQTVKDLADQSNMLALNAAIEAVRSGEHGKGFGVVAREIRTLADQSIEATQQVRDILEDITSAISGSVTITRAGAERMEEGLSRMRATGQTLQELTGIVRDNSAAARQIAAAVSQQNAGISQIFTAVGDLSQMMNETVRRLETTNKEVTSLRQVADQMVDATRSHA